MGGDPSKFKTLLREQILTLYKAGPEVVGQEARWASGTDTVENRRRIKSRLATIAGRYSTRPRSSYK